jgi:superfamily II DNA or RNA helicase
MSSTWEQSLESLLDTQPAGRAVRPAGGVPLGIELTLAVDPRPARMIGVDAAGPRLQARVVRPGRNGWVGGGLSWSKLNYLHLFQEHVASHVRLLAEMYAVYRAQGNHYSYGDEKTVNLAAFDSRSLWAMLDVADEIGLCLVHAKKGLGTVDRYGTAQLCLDVSHRESLVVTPLIQLDGDAVPIRFVGAEGHGIVYVSQAEVEQADSLADCRIGLARLVKAVPPELQRMVLAGDRLEVPAAEQSRFVDGYYPRLRHMAAVISSDESFTPPEISEPTLVLNASYGADHDLEVNWDWVYRIGESQVRAPLHSTEQGTEYRDFERERAILAGLDVSLDRFAPNAVLRGVDTMRFSTEVLPLLDGEPGVAVEVVGDPVAYREAGDSLQIGVSTMALPGQMDWYDLGVAITVEGRTVPFMDVFLALNRDDAYMLLPDGAYFALDKPELRALRKLISEAKALQDMPGDSLRISRYQAGLWDELVEFGVVHHQAQDWQRQVQGLLAIDAADPPPVPAMLAADLRPYQVTGFRWLAFLWECQLGGILADDMGLGKTLQSLALICHAKQVEPAGSPFLVVAPTSVVPNWTAESSRFAPGLKVVSISDTMVRRGKALREFVAGADVVVTSYTLFRLDFQAYTELPWSGLVLDEAQVVKNHQSKIYQCARRLPVPFKLAITGTPMENNLMELWSLLSITAPGLFPNPTRFMEYYARPIERRGDPELLAQLRRRVKPLVKRRAKQEVAADLPAKQEQVLEVELHPRHRKIYQTHLQRERQKILGLVQDMNKNRFTIFRSLTLLRRLSLHAALIDDKHQDIPCAKLDALVEQLQDVIDGEHRALVFSQFTGFLEIVRARLDAAGVEYCYLDGSTRNRAEVLDRFKNGHAPVFLISLKAGGFGLNLTEADYCFLLDPWWNPATEAQAVDRTHRIGQTRNVMVYRLIVKGTIEEKVMALKARKAALVASVMDDDSVFGATIDADDIRGLFA